MPVGPRPAPPVDTARVAISGVVGSTVWTNVFHLQFTTDGTRTAADLKTITDGMVAAYFARFKARQSAACVLNDAKAVWITAVGNEIAYESSYNDAGTNGGAQAIVSAAPVINWSISAYYRGGHPRTYMPGLVTSDVTNNNALSPTAVGLWATAASSFLTDVNALVGTHILTTKLGEVSYQSGGVWRVPPIFRPFNSASLRTLLGTQRRRIGGR